MHLMVARATRGGKWLEVVSPYVKAYYLRMPSSSIYKGLQLGGDLR